MSSLRFIARHTSTRILILSSLCLCVSVVNVFTQTWRTAAEGVEHAQVSREFSGKNVNINLLRLDLKKVRLDVHHALDRAIGRETTSSIAMRKGAIAAINAGFFRLDSSVWAGSSTGVLQIDGKLLASDAGRRTALVILNEGEKTKAEISRLRVGLGIYPVLSVEQRDVQPAWVGSAVGGINRERKQNEVVVYTPQYGETTLTTSEGREFTVEGDTVTEVVHGLGNSRIPHNGFVISVLGEFIVNIAGKKIYLVDGLAKKDRVKLKNFYKSDGENRFDGSEDIVSGVPRLIKGRKIDITWEEENASRAFVETRHPRTAVAKLKDGKFLMLTADGRSETSAGLDLYDLAKYMLELGAVDAMNLDGGGSTTMFLDGKVVNKPSDKEGERKVGDAIVVTLRKRR